MKYVLNLFLRFYKKVISPLFPDSCRHTPSCSVYAMEAIRQFGAFRGFFMAAWRLLRCNPFSKGGFDPVRDNLKGEIKWVL